MRSKVIIWWFNTTWLIIQQFQRFSPSLFHLSEPKKSPMQSHRASGGRSPWRRTFTSRLQGSAGAEETPPRCALRTSLLRTWVAYRWMWHRDASTAPHFDFSPAHEEGSFVPLPPSPLLITVLMDIYSSTLSPALDIGTGCYLLVIGKPRVKLEFRDVTGCCSAQRLCNPCCPRLCENEK